MVELLSPALRALGIFRPKPMANAMGYHLPPASRGSSAMFLFLTHHTSRAFRKPSMSWMRAVTPANVVCIPASTFGAIGLRATARQPLMIRRSLPV